MIVHVVTFTWRKKLYTTPFASCKTIITSYW